MATNPITAEPRMHAANEELTDFVMALRHKHHMSFIEIIALLNIAATTFAAFAMKVDKAVNTTSEEHTRNTKHATFTRSPYGGVFCSVCGSVVKE